MIGGFAVYYVYGQYRLPFVIGLMVAAIGVGIIGVLFEMLFFRRVRRTARREENSILLAIGTALLLENIARSSPSERRSAGCRMSSMVCCASATSICPRSGFRCWASVALISALLFFVQNTRTGRAMRAIAQNREVTLLMGVDVNRISADRLRDRSGVRPDLPVGCW